MPSKSEMVECVARYAEGLMRGISHTLSRPLMKPEAIRNKERRI